MQALVDSHIFVHRLEPKELFRSAYVKKFSKDMPPQSLDDDVGKFLKTGNVPPYLVDFMLGIYGSH